MFTNTADITEFSWREVQGPLAKRSKAYSARFPFAKHGS